MCVSVRRGVSRVALLASQGKEVAEELKERVVTTVAPKVVNGKGKGEGCGNCTAIPLHDGDGDDGATMVKEETAHEDEGLQLTGLKSPEVRVRRSATDTTYYTHPHDHFCYTIDNYCNRLHTCLPTTYVPVCFFVTSALL